MKTTAHAILLDNEDGDEWHELVYWPNDHECAPSATSHLARNFTDRCYAAVEADPTKSNHFNDPSINGESGNYYVKFPSLKLFISYNI